jgi:hypothetical protein
MIIKKILEEEKDKSNVIQIQARVSEFRIIRQTQNKGGRGQLE